LPAVFFYIMLQLWAAYIDIFRSLSCIRKRWSDPSSPLCVRICHFHGEFFSRIYCRTSATLLKKNSDSFIRDLNEMMVIKRLKIGVVSITIHTENSEQKEMLKNRGVTYASWFTVHYFMLPLWTAYIDIFRSLSCIRKSRSHPSSPLCARICHFYGEFFSRIYCRTSTTLLKNSDYFIQDLK
jgi:hypothetical protein